jgi:hypothetical protein
MSIVLVNSADKDLVHYYFTLYHCTEASWLSHNVTSRKVAGLSTNEGTEFF